MSLFNRELMKRAQAHLNKTAVIAAGDPALGGAPMPPGGDPSMGGMPPGGDPAMMGGAPPPPPPAPAPSAPMQPAMMQSSVEPIKPKIDVNVTMLQILKILARVCDALGVKIPASEMVATQGDLTQMGMQQEGAAAAPQPAPTGPQPIGPIDPNMGGGGMGMGGGASKEGHYTRVGNFGKRALAELTFLGK